MAAMARKGMAGTPPTQPTPHPPTSCPSPPARTSTPPTPVSLVAVALAAAVSPKGPAGGLVQAVLLDRLRLLPCPCPCPSPSPRPVGLKVLRSLPPRHSRERRESTLVGVRGRARGRLLSEQGERVGGKGKARELWEGKRESREKYSFLYLLLSLFGCFLLCRSLLFRRDRAPTCSRSFDFVAPTHTASHAAFSALAATDHTPSHAPALAAAGL